MSPRLHRPSGVSEDAQALLESSDVVDLHLDGFIWTRAVGYDLRQRHSGAPFSGHFGGHLDFPRARMFGLTAGAWSITTNPFRTAVDRWRTFENNLERLVNLVDRSEQGGEKVAIARNMAEYKAARATASHIVLPAIQGGNALEAAPDGVASIRDDLVTRITLVHLTNSCYGVTSAPIPHRRGQGLTAKGKELVEQMDAHRVFVDLAHINKEGFWDAVKVHDPSLPLICTHTGVDGVRKHWRNLDDDQLKAIADTGGVIGIIFQSGFLSRPGGPTDGRMVVEHIAHIVETVGEDFAAIGSDYDGMITPPAGLRHEPAYGRLVQWMLDLGWSDTRIRKILGGNFLRSFDAIRPGPPAAVDNAAASSAAIA